MQYFCNSPSPNSRGLINKWKWADFFMQCLNRGLSTVGGSNSESFMNRLLLMDSFFNCSYCVVFCVPYYRIIILFYF